MAQRIYSSQKATDEKANQSSSNSNFAKAEFVNLKPDPATGETVKNLRIIGCFIRFRQFNARKPDMARRAQGDKTATKPVAFPDANINKSYTRIGTEDDPAFGECPWTKLGYMGTWRFAVNVLERQKEGGSVVKILEKGGSIFNKFMEWETNNREVNNDSPDEEPLCVMLGGAVAHDVRIKAKHNPSVIGNVEYTVSVAPRPSKVTPEEIELLKAAGMPKEEEIANERALYEADRVNDPQLPEWEDWFLYGYNLSQIFKPTPLRTESDGGANASTEETDVAELELDAVEPVAVEPAKPATTSKTKKAPAAPEAELANPFDDVFEDAAEETTDGPDW